MLHKFNQAQPQYKLQYTFVLNWATLISQWILLHSFPNIFKIYLSFFIYLVFPNMFCLQSFCFSFTCYSARWLYCCEHLKYVWNVYCVVTNHRRDLHTTETTSNERFPVGHGTNYFSFVLTFSLFTSKQLLFLPICLEYVLYRRIQVWNKLQTY